jgi:hypothetical protein
MTSKAHTDSVSHARTHARTHGLRVAARPVALTTLTRMYAGTRSPRVRTGGLAAAGGFGCFASLSSDICRTGVQQPALATHSYVYTPSHPLR